MANYNFKQDLVEGEEGEKMVVKDLERYGLTFLKDNKDNKFDVVMGKLDGTQFTYEIKTDVICKPKYLKETAIGLVPITPDTGNMFIEFECRGKASGIEVTKAKWFVTYYKYLNEIWYIKTEDLKTLIENNEFKKTEFSGDEGSNTKGYLIPRNDYKSIFIVNKLND